MIRVNLTKEKVQVLKLKAPEKVPDSFWGEAEDPEKNRKKIAAYLANGPISLASP